MKPASVRFYFDADILGVGKLLAGLRSDCTYPGDPGRTIHKRTRPSCVVTTPNTPDEVWIPQVTEAGQLVLTRDSRIRRRVAERRAVTEHKSRMVVLSSRDAGTLWTQLEVLMTQWRLIESLTDKPGPFIYTVSRSNLRALHV